MTTGTKRTDQHRPAAFDPADYRVVDYLDNRRPEPPDPASGAYGNPRLMEMYEKAVAVWQERIFEHFPNWRTGGGDHTSIHHCNHCGHPGIRWVAVVEHIPTGAKLAFGEQCAERVELEGRDAFRLKFIKDRAARERAAYEAQVARDRFDAEHPDVRNFLWMKHEEGPYNDFYESLYLYLLKHNELTDAQAAAVEKSIAREAEFAERRAREQAALATVEPLAQGRYLIEGEIISTKFQDSMYGTTLKMLVKLDTGNKVWGTVPESVIELTRGDWDAEGNYIDPEFPSVNELKGQRVRFTAQVERSHDDPHFGFFKRPTHAEVIR